MKQVINILLFFLFVGKILAQTENRGVSVTNTKDTSVFDGHTYAVIVGVSDYKYVKPLSFADKDALLFKDFLQSKSGGSVKPDNIFLILDKDANASTQPRIRKWLTEIKKIQKGDRVYFYFAGHGDAINPDEYFFLLQDCNPGGDKNNYTGGMASVIQMYNIKSLIKNELIKNGINVVLIWDACRTNELPGGESGLKNMQEGIAEKTDGESIMLSASAGEVALENSNYAHGHGLFTYYLVDGLSGAADNPDNDGNGDGKVDLIELENWVKKKVRVDAKTKFNINQDPRFIYNSNETLSIVDSSFKNEWAMKKISGEDLVINYKNTTKTSGRGAQEADSMVIKLYNQFMESVKNDSLEGGPNSAEELYKQLVNKYPANALTDQAGFNLAMEYINLAQDKINLYLSGKDDITILAASKANKEEQHSFNKTQMLSSGKNYGKNAQYLNRAITLLKQDSVADLEYIKQLQAKSDFLFARSYVSNEGIVTDFSKALQLAKAALSAQPKAAYNYQLFGSLYYINKQYDSSIYYERKALAMAPKWVNAINNLGLAFDAQKKSDSARFYYRKAIAIDPDFLIPYTNLSYNFLNRNSYDSAYRYSKEAVVLNPLYVGGNLVLGVIFHDQKIYDSAKSYYYKVITIDPKYVTAYSNLGILFYNQKLYDSSKNYYYKAIKIDPKYTDAYYNMALVFDSQKQFDSARMYYYKALSVDTGYADAYNGIGIIFQNHLKLYDSARFYYHKAIRIDPRSTYAFYNLGALFYNQNQHDSARYYYKKAIAVDQNYTYAYNALANSFKKINQIDSARYYYNKTISIDPKFTDAYYNLGLLYNGRKQYDSAKFYYRKALGIDPVYMSAYNGLGITFKDEMQFDSARAYYNRAMHIDSKFKDTYMNIGTLFYNLNQYDSAKVYFNKAISIDSDYAIAYNGVGNVFMNQKFPDSAKIYYHKAINADPMSPDAWYNLGLVFFQQNQNDSAKRYYYKVINIDASYTKTYNALANVFTTIKQIDSAKMYYYKAITIDPEFTDAY